MKTSKGSLIAALMTVLMSSSIVFADTPSLMNYQGRLDSAGMGVTGTYSMDFAIYDASTGGATVWSETQGSVTVQDGLFNVLLGSVQALVDTVFNDPDRWLGVTVGASPEMTPRTRLVTVAYSNRVSTVDGATGGIISGDVSIQSDLAVSGKATIGTGHLNSGTNGFAAGLNGTTGGVTPSVGGGTGNAATGDYATVSGGLDNVASQSRATVGGGFSNDATSSNTTVSGGQNNAASAVNATVGGGSNNAATHQSTTVAGGQNNTSSGLWSALGGGKDNTVIGQGAVIAGGENSSITGAHSAILGGYGDTIVAFNSFLFGIGSKLTQDNTFMVDLPHVWFGNEATGYEFPTADGTVSQVLTTDGSSQVSWETPPGGGGGWTDDGAVVRLDAITDSVGIGTASPFAKLHVNGGMIVADKASIGPGHPSTGAFAFVAGRGNIASGDTSVISGGSGNTSSGQSSTVGGGRRNLALGIASTVGGGSDNEAKLLGATVAGGAGNTANSTGSTVGGGQSNNAGSMNSTVSGGSSNSALVGASTVGGGTSNRASAAQATVSGGASNDANGTGSAVGGGSNNKARGQYSVIAGGGGAAASDSNWTTTDYTAVGGGRSNSARATAAVVAGGQFNDASGLNSVVAGGSGNEALAHFSSILGGELNVIDAAAQWSYLFGIKDTLTQDSTFMVNMPHVRFGDETTGFEFPSADGATDQVMSTDGSGQLSWVDPGIDGDWTISGSDMYSAVSGNVGIGTTAPQFSLHVNKDGGRVFLTTTALSGTVPIIHFRDSASTKDWILKHDGGKFHIQDEEAPGNEVMTFQDNGNVGIGTTSPTERLHVQGILQVTDKIKVGTNNSASGARVVVIGSLNSVSNDFSTITGGVEDTITSKYSHIGGGRNNKVSALYSSILGGRYNKASALNSTAIGTAAHASFAGSIVISANNSGDTLDFIASSSVDEVVLRADGGFYLTNTSGVASTPAGRFLNTSTGAYLTIGGVWTNSSDRNKKENLTLVSGAELLEKLAQLDISKWNYKDEPSTTQHIGPMAQDFYALFGLGADDKSISTIDPAGIALAAIQELYRKTQQLEHMEERIQRLEQMLEANAAANSGQKLGQIETGTK